MNSKFYISSTRKGQILAYLSISRKNGSKSNLTELNATDALDNGFMSHNDWVAHGARYGYIAKLAAKIKPQYVLEPGCGRFPLLNYLWRNRSQEAFEYTGIDLRATEKWFEKLGWSKGDVNLLRADLVLDSLDFLGTYDLVVCTEVFEHVPTDRAEFFARQLYRWTEPGGYCVFSTPNAGVSKSTAENHLDENGVSREWSYKDKLNLMRGIGFEIESTYGTFIAKSRIPESGWSEVMEEAAEFLPNAMFTVFAAAAFPAESNNSLFVMRRPR